MQRFICSFLSWTMFLLGATAVASAQPVSVLNHPFITEPLAVAVTPPLRELVNSSPAIPFGYRQGEPAREIRQPRMLRSGDDDGRYTFRDPVAQTLAAPDTTPTKVLDWLGLGHGFFGYSVHITPSDMNLSIGDTQIVQWGNFEWTVFDLQGNNLLVNGQHYMLGSTIFAGLPNCGSRDYGDPIVQWDKVAHRWVMMMPIMVNPARDCIAVSQTADALGRWYVYEFAVPNADTTVSDYPKLGIWPDGFYVSHNVFLPNNGPFTGTTPCAYERTKMLTGDPSARQVCFVDSTGSASWPESFDDNQLPSDLDSPNSPPPAGMPNIYMGSISNTQTGYGNSVYYYKFHVDWNNPTNSTFTCIGGTCAIPVAQYLVGTYLGDAPEPGGGHLRAVANRLMYRLAYRVLPSATVGRTVRDVGPMSSWVVSHAVGNNGSLGVRWYEFRAPLGGTDPAVYQQGTYSPDATWRYMSSLAMDKVGNIALSYTISDAVSINPTIAFTGRARSDPPGTMGPEQVVIQATGSQIDSSNYWGDYYNMAIANDGCTFVTTGQYYTSNSSYNWSTRVVKLKFDNCTP